MRRSASPHPAAQCAVSIREQNGSLHCSAEVFLPRVVSEAHLLHNCRRPIPGRACGAALHFWKRKADRCCMPLQVSRSPPVPPRRAGKPRAVQVRTDRAVSRKRLRTERGFPFSAARKKSGTILPSVKSPPPMALPARALLTGIPFSAK